MSETGQSGEALAGPLSLCPRRHKGDPWAPVGLSAFKGIIIEAFLSNDTTRKLVNHLDGHRPIFPELVAGCPHNSSVGKFNLPQGLSPYLLKKRSC